LLGSDDGVKVWLNGKLIHSNDVGRGLIPRQDKFEGMLNAGNNRILVKVTEYVRGWEVIVEPLDSIGYLAIQQAEKEREDFYQYLNTNLSVRPDWESGITFYAGDKFPDLLWDKPYLVEKIAGKNNLKVKWFDSQLNEVFSPKEPGMYAYYAEVADNKGIKLRKAATLYAYPNDWMGWSEAPISNLIYLPISTIDSNVWHKNQEVIRRYGGRLFNRSSLQQREASVLMSFLDNQKEGDSPGLLNTPIIFDGDYHVALKRKVLGVENKWQKLKTPKNLEHSAITLEYGTEKDAGLKMALMRK